MILVSHSSRRFDPEAIRAAHPFPDYFVERGIPLRQRGPLWVGRCPLHGERHGEAFSVDPIEQTWSCFGKCQQFRRDVIDFVRQDRGVGFREACEVLGRRIERLRSVGPLKRTGSELVEKPSLPPALSRTDLEFCTQARARLYDDARLRQWLAGERGWNPDTLKELAVETFGLGFTDRQERVSKAGKPYTIDNALIYIYPTGYKLRHRWGENPLARGEKWHLWGAGSAGQLWRANLANVARSPKVVVSEGEPDTIRLISAGVQAIGERAVVALPNANSRPDPVWFETLRGKEVILCPDADEAGTRTMEALLPLLHGKGAIVRVVRF